MTEGPRSPVSYEKDQPLRKTTAHKYEGNSNDRDLDLKNRKGGGVEEGDVYAQSHDGPTPVGEILAPRPLVSGRGRPPTPTPYIEQLLTDWSSELHDAEHTRSNITRAMRLYRASGLPEESFVAKLYEARSITKQRGNISKDAQGDGLPGLKNKMPYYFAVLRDLLGLLEDTPASRTRPRSGAEKG